MHFMCFNDIEALRFPSASTDADVCVDRCGHLRRPIRMSASTDADICVDRYGCLRRPIRMSAPTGADVCADRCATKKCEVRTQRVAVFDHKRR